MEWANGGQLRVAVLGDFNATRAEVAACPWVEMLAAEVIESDVGTCWASEEGSTIDLVVLSRSLVPRARVVAVPGPCRPHSGLLLALDK